MTITDRTVRRWARDERLSRAAWSRITEPSDAVAEALRRHLGVGPALLVAMGLEPPPDGLPGVVGTRRDIAAAYRRWSVRAEVCDPERDVQAIQEASGRLIVPGDPEWPDQIDDLKYPPVCLWLRGQGDLTELVAESVAVVGARGSTRYGECVAEDFAIGLAREDVVVVSGAAIGIDAAAHRGALAVKAPTVAVLACGADRSYPASHDLLLDRIASDGLVVSELPPGSTPTRWRFLERNRLIAALTKGTVVVEAGWRSGALNTARQASELSRHVMAVPGPVTSPASAGCHKLIGQGATCVSEFGDVLQLIRPLQLSAMTKSEADVRPYDSLTVAELRVWEAMPVRGWHSLAQVAIGAGIDRSLTRAVLDRLQQAKKASSRPAEGGVVWQRAAGR